MTDEPSELEKLVFKVGPVAALTHAGTEVAEATRLVLRATDEGARQPCFALGPVVLRSGVPAKYAALLHAIGACNSVLAGSVLLLAGYPGEVAPLARRIIEDAAVCLHYSSNPERLDDYVRWGRERRPGGSMPGPDIGKAVQKLAAAVGEWYAERHGSKSSGKAMEQSLGETYRFLTNAAHSGPGIREFYVAKPRPDTLGDLLTVLLGPASFNKADHREAFRAGFHDLAYGVFGLIVSIHAVYRRELDELAADAADAPSLREPIRMIERARQIIGPA